MAAKRGAGEFTGTAAGGVTGGVTGGMTGAAEGGSPGAAGASVAGSEARSLVKRAKAGGAVACPGFGNGCRQSVSISTIG